MKHTRLACMIIALITGATHMTFAGVIHNNSAGGAAGVNNAFTSDDDVVNVSYNGRRVADDVTFASDVTVTGIVWTGIYFSNSVEPASDNFTIAFYNDGTNKPGSLISSFNIGNAVNRTDSGVNFSTSRNIYNYRNNGFNMALSAGTVWVAVYNNSTGTADDWTWMGLTGTGGNGVRENDILDPPPHDWASATGAHMDFILNGSIPAASVTNPVFTSVSINPAGTMMSVEIEDIPTNRIYQIEKSLNGYTYSWLAPGIYFDSNTSQPITFSINPAVNPFLLLKAHLAPP